jgi:carbon-monoxide dehydrogenase large subunit
MAAPARPRKGYVGRSVKRVEDPRLIKGAATYVDDLELPGLLHAAFLRSPHAHARVRKIRVGRAKAHPGVLAVLTGTDVNGQLGAIPCGAPQPGQNSPRHTVLAGERVYFVGHPVAVVVAKDRAAARTALDLIEVDYDPLPAVVDAEQALQDKVLTHPELSTNVAYRWTLPGGDVDSEFARADRIIKVRMHHPRLTPMAMEPRGCVATWHAGEESLTLWTSTQVPHLVRTLLPALVNVPENKVRIVAPEVGGGFGSKLNLYAEEVLVSHLARQLNAPVKWIETRGENAAVTTHGRDQIGDYQIAVKQDGTVLALKVHVLADLGAYLQLLTPAVPTLTALMICGCYRFRAMRMDITAVHTNKMATDAYRGAGRPEAAYAIERLMTIVANELHLDPLEVRKKNFPKPTEFPFQTATGLQYDSGNYQGALKKALELSRWEALGKERAEARRKGRLFGIGVSTYVEICALGPSKTMSAGGWEWGCVRIEISGKVTVITGSTPHGQGQETSFAQIAADRLGVPIADVVVFRGDTAVAHFGRDTYGSRATALGGTAIVMSIDKIVAKAKILAAALLKARPKDVVFEGGSFFVKGKRKNALDWTRLAGEAYIAKNLPPHFEPGLEASSFFEPPSSTFPFGTHIAAVEIDRDTGQIRIVKYFAVDDCGNQINPLLVEGQVQGGIAHSIGQALFEQTVYDENGQLLTGEFMDYAMPRATDIPEYVIGSTVTPSPANPLGVKGVGEAGTIGSTPAIANAVVDALSALGVKHLDMPFTPEKVWRAITRPGDTPPIRSTIPESRPGRRAGQPPSRRARKGARR